MVVDDGGTTHYRLSICNIPMGSERYVKTYLDKKKRQIIQGFDVISKTLDPGRYPHPEIPTRQMQYAMDTNIGMPAISGQLLATTHRPKANGAICEGY